MRHAIKWDRSDCFKAKPDFRSRNELADKAPHRLGSRAFGEAAEEAFRLQQRRAHNAVEIEAVAALQGISLMRIRKGQFLEKSRDSDQAEEAEKGNVFRLVPPQLRSVGRCQSGRRSPGMTLRPVLGAARCQSDGGRDLLKRDGANSVE